MSPAINPATIRRNQPAAKTLRILGNWFATLATAIAVVVVFVHVFDPALNPFI